MSTIWGFATILQQVIEEAEGPSVGLPVMIPDGCHFIYQPCYPWGNLNERTRSDEESLVQMFLGYVNVFVR